MSCSFVLEINSLVNKQGHVEGVSYLPTCSEADYQYLVPMLMPVTQNLFFSVSRRGGKVSKKECAWHEGQTWGNFIVNRHAPYLATTPSKA